MSASCCFSLCRVLYCLFFFFFSSRRRHTRCLSDWSSDVCSSDLHSRSALIPSLVMLPLIQCHQTRGLALSGGVWKPCTNGSAFCAGTAQAPSMAAATAVKPSSFTLRGILIRALQLTEKTL